MQTTQIAGASGGVNSPLVRSLILLVLITSSAVASVFFYAGYRAVGDLSSQAIENSANRTETELQRFFEPVERNLRSTVGWTQTRSIDFANTGGLNSAYMPILRHNPQITSMLLADTQGNEYLLLRDKDEWLNRKTNRKVNGSVSHWERWGADGVLKETWTKDQDYDSATRPWFKSALKAKKAGTIAWTQPYTFFTTKAPGITASTVFQGPAGATYVMGFDVLLEDISAHTTQLAASENGYAAVLTEDERVLGLPYHPEGRFLSREARLENALKPASELTGFALQKASSTWKTNNESLESFRFNFENEAWWGGARPFHLGETELNILVMVPNADYLKALNKQRGLFIGITLLALLAAIGIGIRAVRRFRREIRSAVHEAQQLGQYTIEHKIGSGGMGDVYRASHAMLRRPTAIKLLKPGSVTPAAIASFEREVQLTCRLTHPNTIAIYDYGHTPEGVFYYAMEYLEGQTLLEFVNSAGACPAGRTIYIIRQICESLREAHEIGLIHRDIKLANVFLTHRGGRYDVVKVLDFGLVTELNNDAMTADNTTIAGSPGFLAPETIESPDHASPRSDIYALGAVAYALITAKQAFKADSAMGVLLKQVESDPKPPSEIVDFVIPADLENLIMKCLSRKPDKRPQSMQAVIDQLNALQDAHTWDESQAKTWWKSRLDLSPPPKLDVSPFEMTVDVSARNEIA